MARTPAKTQKKAEKGPTNHWLILILVALAQFMVVLDVSIVNVALPSIQKAFHMTPTSLQWIVTAYSLWWRSCRRTAWRNIDPVPGLALELLCEYTCRLGRSLLFSSIT
jgi:hypothetical protein